MIIYFSGTGNSLRVAEILKDLLHERLYCMEKRIEDMSSLTNDKSLGIVFPVYAWGLPKIVSKFLHEIQLDNKHYVWAVMTCGDDMGYADEVLEKSLRRKVNAIFSVQMPNTYVCLPGFDVDAPDLATQKVNETERQLPIIAEKIRGKENCSSLTRGAVPWLKTYILRPLFNKYLVTNKFFKTNAVCNSCGLCSKQCPVNTITITDNQPTWNDGHCTGCLRCYHNCPQRAIEWGRYTKGKGQKKCRVSTK